MACIYKVKRKSVEYFCLQSKLLKRYFKDYEEAFKFLMNNPCLGSLVTRKPKEERFLYKRTFKKYPHRGERWEVRFPREHKNGYTATFHKKEDAIAFRDLYLDAWKNDTAFGREEIKKRFFEFTYKIGCNEDDKQELEILKMHLQITMDRIKELEGG